MHSETPCELRQRIIQLEAENRLLRERASWALLRLQACMDTARRVVGDLQFELLSDEPAA